MKILSIDDDRFVQSFIKSVLGKEYTLYFAGNGEEGIALAVIQKPDIIILDVEMPGMNGYEVCDHLKHNRETADIPVIFLSSKSDLRERMQGYEAGGDDYLLKPCEPETLLAKVRVMLRFRDQGLALHQQFEEAQKTAHIAMTGSSELGMAMQFVEHSYLLTDYTELAFAFFSLTNRLGLNCSLMYLVEKEPLWFSSNGAVSPLEKDLLVMMREDKRFYDFGCRTIINYPSVSLLVKNMPIADMERYGRVKDLLPAILGALNGKVFTLGTEKIMQKQAADLAVSFDKIKTLLLALGNSLNENQKNSTQIMRTMMQELDMFLPQLGLEDDQESRILDHVEQAIVKSTEVNDTGQKMAETFRIVVAQLQQLLEQQNAFIDEMMRKQYSAKKNDDNDENKYTMDVELF
ncbi:MAG: response regulator [Gammaproteobacteria bacterium]|nr:response regulator [Gammaproteobacteria bacterium]MDH5651915.1 response regulator [Gammaproteobacteria bacterium]